MSIIKHQFGWANRKKIVNFGRFHDGSVTFLRVFSAQQARLTLPDASLAPNSANLHQPAKSLFYRNANKVQLSFCRPYKGDK